MKRGANIKCTAVADMTCPMESCCHVVVDTNFRVYVDMACHMVVDTNFLKIGGGQTDHDTNTGDHDKTLLPGCSPQRAAIADHPNQTS